MQEKLTGSQSTSLSYTNKETAKRRNGRRIKLVMEATMEKYERQMKVEEEFTNK